MTSDRKRNDKTPEMATLKTILNLAALATTDSQPVSVRKGIQSRADLGYAKVAASLLTTEGRKELAVWLEGQIRRRERF